MCVCYVLCLCMWHLWCDVSVACCVLCEFVCVVYEWYVCVACMCGLHVSMCLVSVLCVSACVCGMYICGGVCGVFCGCVWVYVVCV